MSDEKDVLKMPPSPELNVIIAYFMAQGFGATGKVLEQATIVLHQHYSDDLVAAMTLIPKKSNTFSGVTMRTLSEGGWEVIIRTNADDYNSSLFEGRAETLPLAICRAWLRWNGGGKRKQHDLIPKKISTYYRD